MDLINITSYLWNIFLLFLFFLSGTILERTNRTRGTRKSLQLDFKEINSMETIQKMSSTSSTLPTVLALTATPTNTILLSSLTRTTAPTTPPTTKLIKLVSFEQNAKNNKAKQEKQQNQYKRPKKMRRNMKATTADNSHEILNSNMTTALAVTIATQTVDEHGKQEQQPKSFAVLATDSKSEMYKAQEHFLPITLHDSINSLRDIKKMLPSLESPQRVEAQKEMLGSLKLTKMNLQNALATTSKPFPNFYKDQHTSNRSSINELYINDPGIYGNNSRNIMHRNNYDGNGQAANTLSTATITINSFNKSNQAIIVSTTTTTTREPITLATKQNHMYDNNMALSYLPYKSAALKASASDMKTLNNNKNMYSSSSSISRVSSSLKRDTLMSLAGIITTAKAAVVDNSFMKNSSNTHVQDTDDEENVLKIQYNFKSNNSLAHEALAMKQTSQTTVKASTSTTLTIAINETSSSSSSSLPFNVSSTYSGISTAATTKENPTATKPTSSTTTSTSRTTLKSTTRRRKIATTTLKPPPTIDDYQTITSQAGTHAYLPCNVKQLVKKPISWLRVRDGHILTVDQTTFIADQRFQSIYTTNPERWSLQIKYVQLKDAGIYECQVSTEPKASAIVYLHVVEPKTELIGAPTRHVKAGSQVKLLCIISQALEPPLFINWFYNQKQIYLHNRKGWHTEIERIELPPETTTSTTTTTTTTTSTTTTPPTTSVPLTAATSSTLLPPLLPSKLSSTSSSMLNGSEISAMHVFTSTAPQQSLNDGNLLELVSESTNNNYPNLIQPAAASISTALKTQQTHPSTTTTTASAKTTTLLAESTVAATSSIESSTLPGALSAITTTLSFDDTDDSNDDENDDEDDFKTNPTASTFEAAEAIAAGRGYMMLSSLMTFTDVKQITTASLIIPSVQKQDSGNYTCSPSNSEPRTVILHVLNGEYSASAITSVALNLHVHYKLFILNLLIFTLVNSILKNSLLYKQHTIRRYSGG